MHWKTERYLKDAAAVSLITAPVAWLTRQACASNGAIRRAARTAAIGASAAGAVGSAVSFTAHRNHTDYLVRDKALRYTAEDGSFSAVAGGAAGAIVSLVWDAIRAKKR